MTSLSCLVVVTGLQVEFITFLQHNLLVLFHVSMPSIQIYAPKCRQMELKTRDEVYPTMRETIFFATSPFDKQMSSVKVALFMIHCTMILAIVGQLHLGRIPFISQILPFKLFLAVHVEPSYHKLFPRAEGRTLFSSNYTDTEAQVKWHRVRILIS